MATIAAGDLQVHYREHGSGTPVLLIHGNWASSAWWEPVLARLPSGWRGLAPDLRGRGQTTGPDSGYTLPELAADLWAFADALGLDRVHLVGHSLGSAVAMQALLDAPPRVASLTAIAPAWVDGMPAAYNVPASQQALKADRALFAEALKALAPTAPADAFWERLVAEGHEQRLTATLANLPALVAWQPGDRLGETGVPALVIDGELDPLTGGANAERAAAALRARHVVLPGIGHSPIIEAPDQTVALLVAGWLAAP
ncbi:MAG TPA: alpha/beta fold hydrolase [Chloroflexia bacterium]|nr:alpha/beta fold hydrolase [Chloroflexia bacterium]